MTLKLCEALLMRNTFEDKSYILLNIVTANKSGKDKTSGIRPKKVSKDNADPKMHMKTTPCLKRTFRFSL